MTKTETSSGALLADDHAGAGSAADGIILLPELLKKLGGISRTTTWRLERRQDFPQRLEICAGRVGWLRSEVDEWIAKRAASRRQDPQEAA